MKKKELSFFRTQALNLVQAMYGYITPNYRCISLTVEKSIIYIHIILEEKNDDEIAEIIEECMTEFEALQILGEVNYKLNIISSHSKNIRCLEEGLYGITIYQRKEESFLNNEEYFE